MRRDLDAPHDVHVRRRAVLEHGERARDQRIQELGAAEQHVADLLGLTDDGTAVARAQARGTERGHLAQRARPVPRIALRLLGIAGVRHHPDEEIAGAEHAALGTPDPGVIVGLAARVEEFEAHAADLELEALVVEQRGRRRRDAKTLVGGALRDVHGSAELARVDGGVVTGGLHVAREAIGHRAVRDDTRRRLARQQERAEPVGVVDVPVRIDRRVHGRLRALAQARGEVGREPREPRVDQHQPSSVSKPVQEENAH